MWSSNGEALECPFPAIEISFFKGFRVPTDVNPYLPKAMKGLYLSAFHSMLDVEFPSANFEDEMGPIHSISKHER